MRTAFASLMLTAGAVLAAPAPLVSASSTVTGQVLPEVVPPGAVITVDVFGCPTPDTTTITIAIGPQGSPAVIDDSALAEEGAAWFGGPLPTDATAGTWVVDISCLDDGASVVDTGQLTFEVSGALGLTLTPSSGPPGTKVQASGSGCPTGRTETAFLWFVGAGDDLPAWDPTYPGFGAQPKEDGSFVVPFTIPAGTGAGEWLVAVWCVSEGGSALAGPFVHTFMVTKAGTVPATGSSTWVIAGLAAVLVVAGLGLRKVRRVS